MTVIAASTRLNNEPLTSSAGECTSVDCSFSEAELAALRRSLERKAADCSSSLDAANLPEFALARRAQLLERTAVKIERLVERIEQGIDARYRGRLIRILNTAEDILSCSRNLLDSPLLNEPEGGLKEQNERIALLCERVSVAVRDGWRLLDIEPAVLHEWADAARTGLNE